MLIRSGRYGVRVISDLVPNPFVARDIIGTLEDAPRQRGFDDERLGKLSGVIIETLRQGLDHARTARAEALLRTVVTAGRIQFHLRPDGRNWKMPTQTVTTEPPGARVLAVQTGAPVTKSRFAPFYEADLNGEEGNVAVMLDAAKTISWWHRNVVQNQYGLQGWKRGRIYSDFIFAVSRTSGVWSLPALETKGDHLQNPDTDYKRSLLKTLSESFAWEAAIPAGQLELENTGETVECALVLMDDVATDLPSLF